MVAAAVVSRVAAEVLRVANVRGQALEEAVPPRVMRETLPQMRRSLPFATDRQERPPQGMHNSVEAGTDWRRAGEEPWGEVLRPKAPAAKAPLQGQSAQ